MLAPQLAHPERLRDAHRLPCHVQVYEAAAPQKFEVLAAAIFGSAALGPAPATDASRRDDLQLAPLLPAPPRIPRPGATRVGRGSARRAPFRLQLASDPTAEETEPKTCLAQRASQSHTQAKNEHPGALSQAVGIPDQPGRSAL